MGRNVMFRGTVAAKASKQKQMRDMSHLYIHTALPFRFKMKSRLGPLCDHDLMFNTPES